MKKREASKVVVAALILFAALVTAFACALMWHTGDTSALAYLIPAAFTLASTAVGFYFWKAKAENLLKLAKSLEPEKPKRKKAADTTATAFSAALQQSLQQTIDGFFNQSEI